MPKYAASSMMMMIGSMGVWYYGAVVDWVKVVVAPSSGMVR